MDELSQKLRGAGWTNLANLWDSKHGQTIREFLIAEKERGIEIFPNFSNIFKALELTPIDKVKVVIVGQDPYPTRGLATGVAFGTTNGRTPPRTLKNIFAEVEREYDTRLYEGHNSLEGWANQGVLLLNTSLTTQAQNPLSHSKIGWDVLVDSAIKELAQDTKIAKVFILFGEKAKEKANLVGYNHGVVKCAHPSPQSYGAFMGSKPFSQCNTLLAQYGKNEYNRKQIDWLDITGVKPFQGK